MNINTILKRCLWGGLLGMMLITACVSELDFELEGQELIVISGTITNRAEERSILVTRSSSFTANIDTLEASGLVYKDGEEWASMAVDQEKRLTLPAQYQIEEGHSYHVEITTMDNQVISSRPMVVQPIVKTDSMYFEIEERFDGYNINGVPINNRYVVVSAVVSVPDSISTPRYYRWTVDEAWSFKEIPNAAQPNRKDHICYRRAGPEEHPSTVLSTRDLDASAVSIQLGGRILAETFLYKHYFNAHAHAIDSATYEYFSRADRLVSNAGTLYDEVPALLRGNVSRVGEESSDVMGYVEFSLTHTARLPIENFEIGVQLFNQCLGRTPCPSSPPVPGDTTTKWCKCYDCAHIYGFETLNKPSYWE